MGRLGGYGFVGLLLALLLALVPAANAVAPTTEPLPRLPGAEAEPNDTPAGATPIAGGDRVRAKLTPEGDVDYYSFTAGPGARAYAAVMTDGSVGLTDSQLEVIEPDGTTVVSLGSSDDVTRASVENVPLLAGGTYYLRVTTPPGLGGEVLPYDLYLQLQGGTPVLETEPNGPSNAQALPAGGWVRGHVQPGDEDAYSLHLDAGDTVFASLNRNADWPSHVSIGKAGAALPLDTSAQAVFTTVKDAGTYDVGVSGGDNILGHGSYRLSVTVIHAEPTSCRVYSSSGPTPIADAVDDHQWGTTTSAIDVPDDVRLGRVALSVDLDHSRNSDLQFELQTPAGNDIALGQLGNFAADPHEVVGIDDFAASGPVGPSLDGKVVMPLSRDVGRLGWTQGESSAGTWKLVVRDGNPGQTGTLNSWRIVLCDAPPPPAAANDTVYRSDFEADGGGFTHSGTADEWERGTPFAAPIETCASGSTCWKTDLDGFYETPSSQDLVSPPISLAGRTGPIVLSWAQRYALDVATRAHYFVEVRRVGGGGSKRVFEWGGPGMFANPPFPFPSIHESAGWGTFTADLSEFAGQTVEVRFHLDSACCSQLDGVAIDDVAVRAPGTGRAGPDTHFDSPLFFYTRDATPTFAFSSDDPAARFQCRTDAHGFGGCTSPHTTGLLADGPHRFEVRAVDADGNVDPTPAVRSFTVDTKPPAIELSAPNPQRLGPTVSVTVKASSELTFAAASGTVRISGVAQPLKLLGTSYRQIPAGTKSTFLLRVPDAVRAQVAAALRAGRSAHAEIRVSAEDLGAGNRTVAKRGFTLKL